ncbi:MAG: cysteine hydrolase [Oscillospiraceae bacterium]|nr:cysteine hydrolase [Oscillospiraceae bacterium]
MKNYLIVVDMQKDFVDGALGSKEAVAIVPNAAEKIRTFDGKIFVTFDTHFADYMDTQEGKKLPVPHCIKDTDGWRLDKQIEAALADKDFVRVEKNTFGAKHLPKLIQDDAHGEEFTITLIGICTDICVVSNALLLKANFPEAEISVVKTCCAGVTPALHDAAITTMQSCQITMTE